MGIDSMSGCCLFVGIRLAERWETLAHCVLNWYNVDEGLGIIMIYRYLRQKNTKIMSKLTRYDLNPWPFMFESKTLVQ